MLNRSAALAVGLAVLAAGSLSMYDTPATRQLQAQTTPGGRVYPGSARNRRAKCLSNCARRRQARARKCHPRRNKRN